MAYDVLKRLEKEGRLKQCSLSLFREDVAGKKGFIFGRDILSVSRSAIIFTGGETGKEEMAVPLDDIREIHLDGNNVFRRKKRIERVYPR